MKCRFRFLSLILVTGLVNAQTVSPEDEIGVRRTSAGTATCAALDRLPAYFIENRGVYPDEVKYHVQGADKTLFFTGEGVTIALCGRKRGWTIQLEFVGANKVAPLGVDKQEAVFSYFRGREKDWKTGLPAFSCLVYRDLWPGIDLVYRGAVDHLKYEFVVKPGADPRQIALRYRGAAKLVLTPAGGLRVETPEGMIEDAPPFAYQETDRGRVRIKMAFDLDRDGGRPGGFGFCVGRYDTTRPLILDPALFVYCGFIGGSSEERGEGICVDAAGNAYVTGATSSNEASFPVKVGPSLSLAGGDDIFVAKVNAAGTGLVYCGFIGGTGWDCGSSIAVDAAGNAYVAGHTPGTTTGFPVKVGPDLTPNGRGDGFVAKVNATGTGLVYCGYIGGAREDSCKAVSIDAAGNAYVAGSTNSSETTFPVRVGPVLTFGGDYDAFVAKVNPAGTTLAYCGYIGGKGYDVGLAISVDTAGAAYVGGLATSDEHSLPVKVGPDLIHNGGWDAFVAKVNPTGTALAYCGYIGGTGNDIGNGISVDAAGNALVAGATSSRESTFPVRVGPDLTYNGGAFDGFVAKVSATGTGLVYCGYVGGSAHDENTAIRADAAGNAHTVGMTLSGASSFPVRAGPDLSFGGRTDGFVAKVDAAGTGLVYCGYLGGYAAETARAVAVDQAGNAYVTGIVPSSQSTFPVRVGPDLTYNGSWSDAFVAKVMLLLLECEGTWQHGTSVTLSLTATGDAGLFYQLGSSLGIGPIRIDTREIGLSSDPLFWMSVSGLFPNVFPNYAGVIHSTGTARATIRIPNSSSLVGYTIHTAFVTVSPTSPSGIKSISNRISSRIAK